MNYTDIPILEKDGAFNCVVEMTNGDNIEYGIESGGEYLVAKRAFDSIFVCPFSIGFIPQTSTIKGSLTRVVIITPFPISRLSVVRIKPLGTITISDGKSEEDVIISVPEYSTIKKVSVGKVISFFKNAYYQDLKGISVGNYIADSEFAKQIIREDHNDYMDSRIIEDAFEKEDVEESVCTEGTPIKVVQHPIDLAVMEKEATESIPKKEEEVQAVEENTGIGESSTDEGTWLI